MLEEVRTLVVRVQALRKEIRPLAKSPVRRTGLRNEARSIVDTYFRTSREKLRLGGVAEGALRQFDSVMHQLLEVSNRLAAGSTYIANLDAAIAELRQLEHAALEGSAGLTPQVGVSVVDIRVIETLSDLVPSAARSYEQALSDLAGPDRLSWRGPAADLREALRETLDHLAPDEDVANGPGYKLERDAGGPTMKQKVRYVLGKRSMSKNAMATPEAAVAAVEGLVGTYIRSVYTRSSVSTHTPTERKDVLQVRDYVRVALCELLEVSDGA